MAVIVISMPNAKPVIQVNLCFIVVKVRKNATKNNISEAMRYTWMLILLIVGIYLVIRIPITKNIKIRTKGASPTRS